MMSIEDEAARAARAAVVNILRVLRGAGKPSELVQDFESVAHITAEMLPSQKWGSCSEGMATALGHYVANDGVLGGNGSHQTLICHAALRIVASDLANNSTEYGKAIADMARALGDWRRAYEAERASEEAEGAEKVLAQAAIRTRLEDVTARANCRVISTVLSGFKSYVYFITDGTAIKIGKASNPKARLSGLQTSHYKPLRILAVTPGDEELERTLHRRFHRHRMVGEWFSDHDEIRLLIGSIKRGKFLEKLPSHKEQPANDNAPALADAA